MSKDKGPWRDGRRAWDRLAEWAPSVNRSPAAADREDDGERALAALGDIVLARHLLDQAELAAVRAARRGERSWSEIATMLGVSRQAAWEQWRDLDADDAVARVGAELSGDLSAELTERRARSARRRSSVVVPRLVGCTWEQARDRLQRKGLLPVAVGPDPGGADALAPEWPDAHVTDQSPESGAKVRPGSTVRLWSQRGEAAPVSASPGGPGRRHARRWRHAPSRAPRRSADALGPGPVDAPDRLAEPTRAQVTCARSAKRASSCSPAASTAARCSAARRQSACVT